MKKIKHTEIDLNKIIAKNDKIDTKQLARTLKILGDLQKQGINTGPNYNLASPFSQPETSNNPPIKGSVLQTK